MFFNEPSSDQCEFVKIGENGVSCPVVRLWFGVLRQGRVRQVMVEGLGEITAAAGPGGGGCRPAVRDLQEAERVGGPRRTRLPGRAAAATAARLRLAANGTGERTVDGKHFGYKPEQSEQSRVPIDGYQTLANRTQ